MTDFIYHHKRFVVAMIILLIGGCGGIIALRQEEMKDNQNMITDAGTYQSESKMEEKVEIKKEPMEKEEVEVKKEITVDIKGAVNNPNVYQVEKESRIYEIIALAGGLKDTATTKNINLSKKVEDEMVIYIFTEKEYLEKNTCSVKNEYSGEISKEIQEKESVITEGEIPKSKEKISINNASLEELMELDGIGESKAKSIIQYRQENGEFHSLEELINVPGIGESLYEKIKEDIIL